MTQSVRWAVLGAGKFAREHMGPAIHAAHGAELVALGTSSLEKAAPFAAFAPNLRVHETYDAVLSDADVDVVYVPLPNHLHIEWAQKALNAGKHVLVEKPVGLKAAQIEPLIALRDESGLQCSEAFMIAHHPQWTRVREMIAEGAIGELRHVDGFFTYNNPDLSNVRFDAAKGGGSLPDIGVYTIGSTRLATGREPLEITFADIDYLNGVDICARVSARFEGFSAHWVTAMNVHNSQSMTFYGTLGRIHVTAPFNPGKYGEARIELTQSDGAARVERWPEVAQYKTQVEAFCASVRGGAAFAWTLEDARATQAVIDAVYAAATSR
ncbi:Predicted dehydrogenase [Octadecabacter temperatus]|uniref:Glucose--fructose oxidoreductase n=1 Tax=Octadecabacter temperatus TaxID=1458307 RepID=A0A0K0Y3P0_9RHOB|nr:Gfo/Idh/MocA family oxidoreductase [Octadecabacter temperatus]AKS45497.1 Glucose--fructose oxidoreductase precursor [Octadecabacter temperatus]SIN94243.1 Predicted dehydrogenase [Octadecabacter temperatus]